MKRLLLVLAAALMGTISAAAQENPSPQDLASRAIERRARRQSLATAAARTLIARRRSARRAAGLAVATPAGHGPVRWSLHDVEHRGCATCERARGLVAERLRAAHLSSKAISARP